VTPGLVSILVVNWNGARLLESCLASVHAQDYQPFELIVVDNGSVDGSAEIAARDEAVHLIRNVDNLGFAVANNIGIDAAGGEFVLLLNYDVRLRPDYVGLLVARLQQDAGLGSVSGKLLRAEPPDVIDSAGHVMFRNVWPTNRGEDEPDGPAFDLPGEVFGVCAAAGLYRRTMLDDIRINGEILDATFFAYLEDVDLDWRARSRGWRSWYEPAAVAIHSRSGSGAWGSAKLQRHILKNRLLLIVKNDGGVGLLARLPGMVAFTGAKAVQLLVTRPAALLGALDAVRLLPTALAKRRIIQRRRTVPRREIERFFEPYPYLRKARQGRVLGRRRPWTSPS
jgi:GT2 family glycosyltransferase